MKTYILLLITILFFSCEKMDKETKYNTSGFVNYEIVTIDSCEYIMYRGANAYNHITHKGNCKFCKNTLNQ